MFTGMMQKIAKWWHGGEESELSVSPGFYYEPGDVIGIHGSTEKLFVIGHVSASEWTRAGSDNPLETVSIKRILGAKDRASIWIYRRKRRFKSWKRRVFGTGTGRLW